VERMAIWGVFVVVLTLAILARPRPMRIVVGVFFVLMAVGVHGSTVLTDPSSYLAFANGALIPLYRDIAVAVVGVNPVAFGLFMLSFELVIAALILWHGRAVRLGLWAGVVFLLGITPLGVEELPNLVLALGLALLATRDFPKSALCEVQEALSRRLPGRATAA
jgi:hypothetical protein